MNNVYQPYGLLQTPVMTTMGLIVGVSPHGNFQMANFNPNQISNQFSNQFSNQNPNLTKNYEQKKQTYAFNDFYCKKQ